MVPGYAGRILRVDLTTGRIEKEDLDEGFAKRFLGGKGFGTKILYDEFSPQSDAFSSENLIVISNGPLTGTGAFAPKCNLATKSPLTGGWLDCTLGGFIGSELKFVGYDIVIISGKSPEPVYLWINGEKPELRRATHLWGKDCHETERAIKQEVGLPRARVASIGPAGEKLVRYACVTGDLYRQAGRGGIGAVWGSKNLKALAVKGSGKTAVADRSNFDKHVRELNKILKEQGEPLATYGTMWLVDPINDYGMLPTRNFQEAVFEGAKKITGERLVKTIKARDAACYKCALHCANICSVKEGEFGPFEVEGPEYETACLLGSNCGVDKLEAVAYLNLLCDRLGMDTISTGGVLAFAMECYQRGIITTNDTDGLALDWGNYQSMVELVKRIAARKGMGHLLAEGSVRAAEQLGKGATELAMHVKGMEMPGYEPRGAVGMGLAYATADRGACHLRAWTIYEEVMGEMDRFSPEGKPMLVAARMRRKAIMDSLGICEVMGLLPIFATLLADATGWKVDARYNSVFEKLLEDFVIDDGEIGVGERITNLARCFNVREGFGRREDALPGRFLRDYVPAGPVKGHRIEARDFERMLNEYYSLCGWNEDGIPTREKLSGLGLEKAARDLWPEV